MKLAIVGSRNYNNYLGFKTILCSYLKGKVPIMIISGGAKGVDSLAERYAKEKDIEIKIFYPEWSIYGRKAGPMRNLLIVKECTHMLALPSQSGKGTQNSIKLVGIMNKPVFVCYID